MSQAPATPTSESTPNEDTSVVYQQCTRCVMDTTDPAIRFDPTGVCNHCTDYRDAEREQVFKGQAGEQRLAEAVATIAADGQGREYDCVIGLSGGVDSSYVAYVAVKAGLRPLAVHFDNGWNTELAVSNVESIVKTLGLDLYTHVVNWEEFKDVQLAYLKASVIDVEVPTDQCIVASIHEIARRKKIKHILDGCNVVTEGILPLAWIQPRKLDYLNLKSIHDEYGTLKLKDFPAFTPFSKLFYRYWVGIRTSSLLNYVPYEKQTVKELLAKELGWRDYGGKHCESTFTKFYQHYILPTKFGVDKRKAHLSTLVASGQMGRDEALAELAKPLYSEQELATDRAFVLKKLGLTEEAFEELMARPIRQHSEFAMEQGLFAAYPFLAPLRPLGRYVKRKLGPKPA